MVLNHLFNICKDELLEGGAPSMEENESIEDQISQWSNINLKIDW